MSRSRVVWAFIASIPSVPRFLGPLTALVLLGACQAAQEQAAPSASPASSATPVASATPASSATLTPMPSATRSPEPTSSPTAVPPTPTPTLDTGAQALRPAEQASSGAPPDLPHYHLWFDVDPQAGTLQGLERIHFINRTGVALETLALRLYPNFPGDLFGKGGNIRMDVREATIDGQPVAFEYAAQDTAVLLPLSQPLAPGGTAELELSFQATIETWSDGNWALPSYYPILAVYDQDGWRLDVTQFPDRVYAESAYYKASIRVPGGYDVASSGNVVNLVEESEHLQLAIVAGPIREFALSVGRFDVASATGGENDEVEVNVYVAEGSALNAQQIADVSAAALSDFDQRFGRYPYNELDIHLMPGEFDGGDEYPGLILLYSGGAVDAGTRYVAAHEVAHQWWYCVVGNDIYRQPWLDEALAQYSGIIYAEDMAGAQVAADDWEREVRGRYSGALADGDLPVGLGIHDYPSFNVYYRTVYGKGAVFLRTLREQIGDEAFFGGLQIYYQRHRHGIGSTNAAREAFEQSSGQDLAGLFERWVNP